jgi:cytochrome bd ubiquinol oxidase subunit II
MHLDEVPLGFALIGLVLYTVLGGADFGAGMQELTAGRGPAADRIRELAHDSMAPVWEANHVWLIFVLTVVWTAYPTAFGSIASTLSIPLFIAAVGIILRGATYALRSGSTTRSEARRIDMLFAASSMLTPFAMGTIVGGIASGRVPVGNAAGNLVSSWVNPLSLLIGVLAVATSADLAAVFLAADAHRQGDADMERRFRARALLAGAIAGAVAVAGLAVLHSDAPRLLRGLLEGRGLLALVASIVAGLGTMALVVGGRFGLARATAALAVGAIIAGWAVAQAPTLLPGLTIDQAAAPHDTLVVVVAAVLIGAVILFPSLALLFDLVLRGRFDPGAPSPARGVAVRSLITTSGSGLLARSAAACAIAGFGLLTLATAGWAHAVGVVCLLGFVVVGFLAVAPWVLASEGVEEGGAAG